MSAASRIDWTPLLAAVGILQYHGVALCVGGEAVFAYYNFLFVDYDRGDGPVFEIIVPQDALAAVPGLLCSTGLFTTVEAPDSSDFDGGWRSSNDFPHLQTTAWNTSRSPVAVIPDIRAAIPLDRACTFVNLADTFGNFARSPDLEGLSRDEIRFLPWPRLPTFVRSLPWPRLPTFVRSLPWRMDQMIGDGEIDADADSGAELANAKMQVCVAVEDLVDGMDISGLVYTHLAVQNPKLCELVRKVVSTKNHRVCDAGLDNDITRGIRDASQLDTIRAIPGRD